MSSVHIITGNLGRDVEIRAAGNGRVATLAVADTSYWKNAEGARQERTQWHEVVTFQEGLIKMLEQHAKKGRLVYVKGSVTYQKWRKDGEQTDRTKAQTTVGPHDEINFLDRAPEA